jgi:hypothetical protein
MVLCLFFFNSLFEASPVTGGGVLEDRRKGEYRACVLFPFPWKTWPVFIYSSVVRSRCMYQKFCMFSGIGSKDY